MKWYDYVWNFGIANYKNGFQGFAHLWGTLFSFCTLLYLIIQNNINKKSIENNEKLQNENQIFQKILFFENKIEIIINRFNDLNYKQQYGITAWELFKNDLIISIKNNNNSLQVIKELNTHTKNSYSITLLILIKDFYLYGLFLNKLYKTPYLELVEPTMHQYINFYNGVFCKVFDDLNNENDFNKKIIENFEIYTRLKEANKIVKELWVNVRLSEPQLQP